jgi:hypothetical protein
VDFAIDGRLVPFQMCGFARGPLAALDALSNSILLVLGLLSNFTFGIGVLHRSVVLILLNLVRELVLLLVQGGAVSTG